MSYGVMAFLVDSQELLNLSSAEKPKRSILGLFGSGKSARDDILRICSSELDDLDEMIREDAEVDDSIDSTLSSTKVLDEFLENNIGSNAPGWVYGYVFKILCEYKGMPLNNAAWYPCSSETYYAIPFAEFSLPIKFPDPDDFPAITYVDHESINLEEGQYDGMDEDQIAQLKEWFNQAINNNKDIYLFYH